MIPKTLSIVFASHSFPIICFVHGRLVYYPYRIILCAFSLNDGHFTKLCYNLFNTAKAQFASVRCFLKRCIWMIC